MTATLTRRRFAVIAAAPALVRMQRKSLPSRPNFLFMLTDDQRWDATSHMGCPLVATPHMDRLAREGARFSNAFVTTSLCSPSRASYLTGQYVRRHGIRGNREPMPDSLVTYPKLLQQAGYDTAYFGKWHMGTMPERPGFAHYVSFRGQGNYADPTLDFNGRLEKTPGYLTDLLAGYAENWLKEDRRAPFLMYFGQKAPHGPFEPAPRHRDAFAGVPLPRPANVDVSLEGKPEWVKKRAGNGARNNPQYENTMRNYYRTLLSVDDSLGRVLEVLEHRRMLDQTCVIYASDNGYFHGEHGLSDKRAGYDEALRIPLLVRYPPLVKAGSTVDAMSLNVDVAPTVLELAGVRAPDGMQGRSLAGLLRGRAAGWRTSYFYEYFAEPAYPSTPDIEGVRDTRWKYLRYPGINDLDELYDLRADPLELTNLAQRPSSVAQLRKMRTELERLSRAAA